MVPRAACLLMQCVPEEFSLLVFAAFFGSVSFLKMFLRESHKTGLYLRFVQRLKVLFRSAAFGLEGSK